MEGGHIHCMKKKDNILKFKPKKPKPMKYWLCEFFKRYGEDENTYHYIFSDKNIKDMKYKGNGDDHKILSQFFLQKITPLAKEERWLKIKTKKIKNFFIFLHSHKKTIFYHYK